MNATYIYQWMTAAAGHLKNGANGNAAEIIEALKAEAAAEIRREEAKRSGNGSRQKAAERVIKNAVKLNPEREALHGAWIEKDKQCICDGVRLFRFSEPLPLPEMPEKEKPIDAARIVDPAADNAGATLEAPAAADLRVYIKTEKAQKKASRDRSAALYDFGEGLPAVNAQYLLDVLEMFPDAVLTASARRPLFNAIYIRSEHGDGVILPVKKEAQK